MINRINSNQNFGRKEDVACVKQARTTLNNIFQKYANNKILREDKTKDVLILGKSSKNQEESASNIASDEKVRAMSRLEVKALLLKAENALKSYFSTTSEQMLTGIKHRHNFLNEITKAPFTQVQKNLLHQMQQISKSEHLVSIPKK